MSARFPCSVPKCPFRAFSFNRHSKSTYPVCRPRRDLHLPRGAGQWGTGVSEGRAAHSAPAPAPASQTAPGPGLPGCSSTTFAVPPTSCRITCLPGKTIPHSQVPIPVRSSQPLPDPSHACPASPTAHSPPRPPSLRPMSIPTWTWRLPTFSSQPFWVVPGRRWQRSWGREAQGEAQR